MDYSLIILSVCIYVENRVKKDINVEDMEQAVGYSYPHIRKIFKENMQISFSRYMLLRKLSCAAFDMIHTENNLVDIAVDYGFEQYDTFTRAFKRETGVLPSSFRMQRTKAGRKMIAAGVYAPAILDEFSCSAMNMEGNMDQKKKTNDSCILFGVPKVEYKWEELTPFPACLRSCLNYMGRDISYTYLMAVSGAAFRLRWNKKFWDGGNVDISYIYDDPLEAFSRSLEAAGRSYRFLKRAESSKEDFKEFIKAEIDEGRPVIAFGVIGPPEACIVTGYQEDGDILLGWNFFQHRSEYNKGTTFYENGYFISSSWWENKCTNLLISIGETQGKILSDRDILANAINVVDREVIVFEEGKNVIACGQEAYETWAEWTADDRQFYKDITLPLLNERFMCQSDAEAMVGEGRWYASEYLKSVGERHREVCTLCSEATKYFRLASETTGKMNEVLRIDKSHEDVLQQYVKSDTRNKIKTLIYEAAEYEKKAIKQIEVIIGTLE